MPSPIIYKQIKMLYDFKDLFIIFDDANIFNKFKTILKEADVNVKSLNILKTNVLNFIGKHYPCIS